jgi:hypothetical protein
VSHCAGDVAGTRASPDADRPIPHPVRMSTTTITITITLINLRDSKWIMQKFVLRFSASPQR